MDADQESLKAVQPSLQEASAYERLALQRRRGVLGLAMSVVLAPLALWRAVERTLQPDSAFGLGLVLCVVLGGLFLQMSLRKRPGWEPIFGKPSGPRHWFWVALWVVFTLASAGLPAYLSFKSTWSDSTNAGVLSADLAIMAFLGARISPRLSPARLLWIGPLLVALLFFMGALPASFDLDAPLLSMILALFLVSGVRALAPGRWLVR